MTAEWRGWSIGGLCDAGILDLQTGPFGSQLHAHDYVEEGVPVVPTEAIHNRRIDHSALPTVSLEKADQLARHRLREGDILFARRGAQATGQIAYVSEAEVDFLCGTGAIRLRVIDEQRCTVVPEYLSHVLGCSRSMEWFKFHAIGATMPNLNEGIIRSFPLRLPSLQEQRAIANVLSTLDDKIELNRRMNETLEAMARALFKSWFVDFDPVRAKAEGRDPGLPKHLADLFPDSLADSPLGTIPKGWHASQLGEIASMERETLNPGAFPEETFDHYSIPAYDEGREPKTEAGEEIKSNKFLLPAGAVLLSKLNPRFPRVWLPEVSSLRRSICSTEFIVLVSRSVSTREYLYCLCISEWFFATFATLVTGTSSSHQRVKPEDLLRMQVVIPSDKAVSRFSDLTAPLLRQVIKRSEQSHTLAALRDALLPKLVSGEIRVKV